MTSGRDPVAVSSQGVTVVFAADEKPEGMADQINDALGALKEDIQRLAGQTSKGVTTPASSGTYRLVAQASGIMRAYAVSDTATAGSTGAAYHIFNLQRNGVSVGIMNFDTRRAEMPAYLGGAYLGEVTVSASDVISIAIAVTGAPVPTLTTANLCLSCTLRSN